MDPVISQSELRSIRSIIDGAASILKKDRERALQMLAEASSKLGTFSDELRAALEEQARLERERQAASEKASIARQLRPLKVKPRRLRMPPRQQLPPRPFASTP